MPATQDCRTNRIETGNTGWISIRINDPEFKDPETLLDVSSIPDRTRQRQSHVVSPPSFSLFEHAQTAPVPLPERFPRLTFFLIAIALLTSALTAEFDYLRGAGYYWP